MAPATAPPFGTITLNALVLVDPDDGHAEEERMTAERRSATEIEAGLHDQLEAVLGNGPHGNSSVSTPGELPERIARSNGRATDALNRMMTNGVDLGVNVVVDQFHAIGIGFNYRLANQIAAGWAKEHAFELQKRLDATTRDRAGAILAQWIESGESGGVGALRDALTPWFGKFRAERIASTEITRAFAEGSRRAYMQSGVVEQVEWQTSNDDEVCPICRPLNGKRGPLQSGVAQYGFPPAHATCRCRIAGVTISTLGDENG